MRKWAAQGAEIIYLTSRRDSEEIHDIKKVLNRNNFPKGILEYRRQGEEYGDVAMRTMPDILIEDDCKSIGGEKEMTHPHIKPEARARIQSIVVKEFEGIDHLPGNLLGFTLPK